MDTFEERARAARLSMNPERVKADEKRRNLAIALASAGDPGQRRKDGETVQRPAKRKPVLSEKGRVKLRETVLKTQEARRASKKA